MSNTRKVVTAKMEFMKYFTFILVCVFSVSTESGACPSLGCLDRLNASDSCPVRAELLADGVYCPACAECWTENMPGFRLKDDGCPALFHECHVTEPFPGCDFQKFVIYKGQRCEWCYEQVC